ncbi:MAG: hypothetical protein WBW81_05205 [Methylocella sp.]
MQDIAGPPVMRARAERAFDDIGLIFFGDRRERNNLPGFLFEHMADEINFVQALHDEDDAARPFVVEAAQENRIIPIVAGRTSRIGERLVGF